MLDGKGGSRPGYLWNGTQTGDSHRGLEGDGQGQERVEGVQSLPIPEIIKNHLASFFSSTSAISVSSSQDSSAPRSCSFLKILS